MPKTDPSDQKWLRSLEFYNTPQSQLLFAVIAQAIEDSATEIKDPPELPKYPPKKPKEGASEADMEVYAIAKINYDRRVRRISGKRRFLAERQLDQAHARYWLMAEDSNFPKIAGLLGIDADVIRDAISLEYDWARVKRWRNINSK